MLWVVHGHESKNEGNNDHCKTCLLSRISMNWSCMVTISRRVGNRKEVAGTGMKRCFTFFCAAHLLPWASVLSTLVLRLCAPSLHLCPAFCDPLDCSPPGSSVHGILQSRVLERVAMTSSRGSSLGVNSMHSCSRGSSLGVNSMHSCSRVSSTNWLALEKVFWDPFCYWLGFSASSINRNWSGEMENK